ncbi:hypothetical protein COV53_01855 [Candidatus Gottesmanbacteria bacterium CG11_big_fil_rev_8_21_14_0_20_37_11]|uniref:Uncharacterized protein n=1 Tax=Candidatus Gottesmanbacteria bacterium CG11_big_fil_rev_8_21_14_0_20_37_11 TaxID=1974575 RepID=A0A2H0NIE9_9BACT|nr:MAG: hypothetical protein COV53_01855 [Candidatus Gottesmanbacteria bacterium CG11_big_fil_rev_8_21_14_0_20_37_11]
MSVRGGLFNLFHTTLTSEQCRAIGSAMLDPEAPELNRRFYFIIRGDQESIADHRGGAFRALFDAISIRRELPPVIA